jgi:hypothetical protein
MIDFATALWNQRGEGNSTCVFAEAAHRLGGARVVSIDHGFGWDSRTVPRLREVVSPEWLSALEILHQNIFDSDFGEILAAGERVFVFWDAHGWDLALCVLREALPHLQWKHHVIAVHDVSDTRYHQVDPAYSGGESVRRTWLGHLASASEEFIPLYDFLSRNRILFETPEHSLDEWVRLNREKAGELESCWGADFPAPSPLQTGHWIYFDVRGTSDPAIKRVFPTGLRTRRQKRLARLRATGVWRLGTRLYRRMPDGVKRAVRRAVRLQL